MLLLVTALAHADDPWRDTVARALAQAARDDDRALILGDGERAPWRLERRPIRLGVSLDLTHGTLRADDAAGVPPPGGLGAVLRPEVALARGPWVAWARPGVLADSTAGGATVRPDALWVGLDRATPQAGVAWTAGFGKRDRWTGPGRFGNLARTDHAVPPWMAELAIDAPVGPRGDAGRRPGRIRAELDGGWLDRPRTDVEDPGLLVADVRWGHRDVLELGATRMTLFGGVGRPAVDPLQLLIPTEPHIYGDPQRLRPDQDEIAVLDARIGLPRAWRPAWLHHAEAWIAYGGEDLIVRERRVLPVPELAGIANLGGAEIAAGAWTLTAEAARLQDDTFRWYVGHRVYHLGFTQDARPLGHPGGTDSESRDLALSHDSGERGVRLRVGTRTRVGVLETRNGRTFTLATDERTLRAALEGDAWLHDRRARVRAGVEAARIEGANFVPGAVTWPWRAWAGVELRGWSPGADTGALRGMSPAPGAAPLDPLRPPP
jgi:hypothetical protein